MLATFRAIISILGSSFIGRWKRKPVYLTCCTLSCIGNFTLATYYYFNQGGLLTTTFPIARWIPIIAIMLIYVSYAFGIGSICYMFQVLVKAKETKKRLLKLQHKSGQFMYRPQLLAPANQPIT
jgi:uncharacterized membrane protein